MTRYSRAGITQIERAMRDSQALALLRVVRVENGQLRGKLVGDIIPPVLGVVVDLEDFVGHGGEDLVDLEEISLGIDAQGVEKGEGEVTAWP